MPLPLAPQPPPAPSPSLAWLLASDPAFLRARRGAQATLSAVLTVLVLWLIGRVTGASIRSMAAGVMIAIFAVVMVREQGRAQHLTTGAMILASGLSATLAAALLPSAVLQPAAFIAVIFAAVWARRFGPRWAAAGMAAYVSYLIVCYLRTPLAEVANQWLGIVVGALIADLWRGVLLRERPGKVLVGAARAAELRAALALAEIEAAARRGGWTARRRRRLIRARNGLLQDRALIEQQLRLVCADADAPLAWELRRGLLVLDVAVQAVSRAALHETPSSPDAARLAGRVRRALLERHGPQIELGDLGPAEAGFAHAVSQLSAAEPIEPVARALAAESPANAAPAGDQAAAGGGMPAPAALRQAIQTALACGLAAFGGMMLSHQRWLWAVIAAYVVFAGVKSTGHVLVKGLQRTAGTVAGVLAGVGLATLVSGHTALAAPLLTLFVFLTFYSFQASYTAMIFWLTLALALLYGLMGYFRPELLVLRLEETLIGSAAGAAVALLLFRKPTHQAVWSAGDDFLRALGKLIGVVADGAPARTRLGAAGELDLAFAAARDLTRPNAGSLGPPTGRGSAAVLEALADCRYFAGVLALSPPEDSRSAELQEAQRLVETVRRGPKAGPPQSLPPASAPHWSQTAGAAVSTAPASAAQGLQQALARLGGLARA